MRVENIDLLNEYDPPVLVQRYYLSDHAYQVFRKPTEPDDEEFMLLTHDVEGTDEPWSVSSWLTDPDPEELEIFAHVYWDRGGLPGNEGEEDDYLFIEYDPEDRLYHVHIAEGPHDTVEGLTGTTLTGTVARAVAEWDKSLRAHAME